MGDAAFARPRSFRMVMAVLVTAIYAFDFAEYAHVGGRNKPSHDES